MNPSISLKLAEFRSIVNAGGKLTVEQSREVITLMREGRVAAAATSSKARTAKAAKAPVDADDLLSQLDNL